jgi:hypothetical protein
MTSPWISPFIKPGEINPNDYRRDETGQWVLDPGWWREIAEKRRKP